MDDFALRRSNRRSLTLDSFYWTIIDRLASMTWFESIPHLSCTILLHRDCVCVLCYICCNLAELPWSKIFMKIEQIALFFIVFLANWTIFIWSIEIRIHQRLNTYIDCYKSANIGSSIHFHCRIPNVLHHIAIVFVFLFC